MPNYRHRYPDNWSDIAIAVKEAAGWRCAKCGWQCQLPGEKTPHLSRSERMAQTLQVHHWNRNPEDNSKNNLVALCTSCHLAYHQGGKSNV
ncbi:MAG: HNH endonuclease [Symploca sp. SIO2E9]|nr:HNH endonuclease [Symploca sp. SIO2E9]